MTRPALLFCSFVFSAAFFYTPSIATAATTGDTIESLKAEIASYQNQLKEIGSQKVTLQSTISELTLKQKELGAQIKITQTKISTANGQIKDLNSSIGDTEESISENQSAIAKALRTVAQDEKTSLVTQLISSHSMQDAWQAADVTLQFNRALGDNISDLRISKTELSKNRDKVTAAKTDLVSLQNDLKTQNTSVAQNKTQQQRLLAQTQNSEVTFQKLLTAAKAELASFSAFTTGAGGSGILTNQTVCDGWGCYYNQRDSQWGNMPLSGTRDRLAAYGCLVTSVAMVLTHYGYGNVNPISVNSNPSNFSPVGGLMLYTIYVGNITATRTKESVATRAIDSILASGNPVIAGLRAYGGTHFVVIVSGSNGSYLMRDPYVPNGSDIDFTTHYKVSSIFSINKLVVST